MLVEDEHFRGTLCPVGLGDLLGRIAELREVKPHLLGPLLHLGEAISRKRLGIIGVDHDQLCPFGTIVRLVKA
jgi:hypothetical protein